MDFSTKVNIALACTLLFFALRGAWRGLSGELSPIIALAVGVTFAWFSFHPLRVILLERAGIPADSAAYYAALIALILTLVLFIGLRTLLKKALKIVVAQPFDAILGGLLGSLKIIVLVSLFSAVYQTLPVQNAAPKVKGLASFLAAPWLDRFATTDPRQ